MKNSRPSLKSKSKQNLHHKSVQLIVQTPDSPPKKRTHSPSMSALETERLVNRLTDLSSCKGDYGWQLNTKQKELRAKCEKLYATIELFQLMDSNNMALRCMQHNNALTLYCLTERKILCVNCTYSQMKHRTHKVLPLKDSAKYIHQDNQELNKILKEDFKILENSIKNSKENVAALNSGLTNTLRKMEENYKQKLKELEVKYHQSVRFVKTKFEDLVKKSQGIEKQIEDFKFKVYECLSRVGLGKNTELTLGDMPVIKQLTKFQLKKITQKQMQRLVYFTQI